MIIDNIDGVDVVGHDGDISGFNSIFMKDINEGKVIIILSNKQDLGLKKLCSGLLDVVSK